MALIVKGKLIDKTDPIICVPIRKPSQEQVLGAAYSLVRAGVKMVEWRIDCFEDLLDESVFNGTMTKLSRIFSDIIFLVTLRSSKEGGSIDIGQAGMKRLIGRIANSRLVDIIDIEYFYFEEDDLKEIIENVQRTGTSVLLSNHDFNGGYTKEGIDSLLSKMEAVDADIIKVALKPQNEEELRLLQDTINNRAKKSYTPYVFVGMGETGYESRIAPEDYSSALTFAAFDGDEQFGQISYTEMMTIRKSMGK